MPDAKPTCQSCKWWEADDPVESWCNNRSANAGISLGKHGRTRLTFRDETCGEHAPKEAADGE